jgi:hypothetical protein
VRRREWPPHCLIYAIYFIGLIINTKVEVPGFIPGGRGRQLHRSCSDAGLDATTLSMDRPIVVAIIVVARY